MSYVYCLGLWVGRKLYLHFLKYNTLLPVILHQISIDDIISLLRADGHIKRLLEYLFETIHYVDKGRMPVCPLIFLVANQLS